jgi:hypothetical protein
MKKTHRFISILALLAMVSLACQSATSLVTTPTLTPPPPTVTGTATRTPRPTIVPSHTPTPLAINMDSTRKVISGGFSYAPLDGFDKQNNNHEIYMLSEDEKLSVLLSARAPYPGEHLNTTLKYYMEWAAEEYQDFVESDREDFTHEGADGVSKYFTGKEGGKPFQARIAYLRPGKGKMLLILVYAYGENAWEDFGEEAYQKTLEKITFFEIAPWSDCPVSSKPSYGYSKENPIKLGGELLSGPELEEEYLSALIGTHGEVVFYYRIGSVNQGELILDEYEIRFGGQIKKIYIDIYNYEPPKAPAGLTCSGPFPFP